MPIGRQANRMAPSDMQISTSEEAVSADTDLKAQDSLRAEESHVLQERNIGVFGAISLVVNKIVGAGIFSTPATIFKLSGSVGMALIIWVIAGLISTCGALVMLELGTRMPRSGGMKVYLEAAFAPKLLITCIYLFYCVFLQVSASNAITTSSYLLQAAGVDSTTWRLRGLAIAASAFAVGIHTVWPRGGKALQDLLSLVKLVILLFIVCTGFAALAGHVPDTHNFDISTSFRGTSNDGYSIGTALLNAIFAFHGYDNVNTVLSEVRNPHKTLRIALPAAMGLITVLYILANIAYFAAVPRDEFLHSEVTIAANLFSNVFGQSAAVKALPALVAISALGHLLGIAFTVPRVIQELGKDGIAPFPNIVMQNRPFRTPIVALLIHLGVTILFTCAPPAGDAFNFVVKLSSYPTTVLLTATTIGLIKLRFSKTPEYNQPTFRAPWPIILFYLAGSIFLVIMPFIPPQGDSETSNLPYWLSPVVALGILGLGFIYYVVPFVLMPLLFGYKLRPTAVELSDGSHVTRYRRKTD
ncbi:amino acid transporter [Aspergillus steynii IBT 23096]|uniref:Amino acid transporter n=1 Tax=Aspergillus steynii IBT 23096 TaxID=1392250 RepID=A0A2I2FTX8_9EURO|nr:amino acid transporter [Aspergillus steynii IBT 23096]PLB44089.1 amino acid transporter [Aspergillus steynii IBT 23096]